MYYVYVLRDNKEGKSYIGYTGDLERRVNEHTLGMNHTTRRYSDIKLVFYEGFSSKEDAVRREKYLKTTKGRKALKIMLRNAIEG